MHGEKKNMIYNKGECKNIQNFTPISVVKDVNATISQLDTVTIKVKDNVQKFVMCTYILLTLKIYHQNVLSSQHSICLSHEDLLSQTELLCEKSKAEAHIIHVVFPQYFYSSIC